MNPVQLATRRAIVKEGWRPGTTLEDTVCHLLGRWCPVDEWKQQYRVGRYRLDFAIPLVKVALEVDGPRHRYDPHMAMRDAQRDSWLRSQGWIVIRIDDEGGEECLADLLCNVVRFARAAFPRP
jgi:very-short-patch-repair endonuclease